MLLQKFFFLNKDKYSISIHEIDDLFDIEEQKSDIIIYNKIITRYDSILKIKFKSLYIESKKNKNMLYNFLKKYLFKKCVNSKIKIDLYMNELKNFSDKFLIEVVENNTIYNFRLSDIVNLWVSALLKSEQLFIKPLEVKNPYTNIKFSKTTLYNIYFKLIETNFIIPSVIHNFVSCNMNIQEFSIEYFPILKDNAIKNFIKEGHVLDKYEHIINMLHDYRKTVNYYTASSLCSLQSKIKIVRKLKKYLCFYLNSKYSCNPLIKDHSKSKLKTLLKDLIEGEPYFGLSINEIVRHVPLSERNYGNRSNRMSPRPSASLRRRRRPIYAPPPPPTNNILENVTQDRPIIDLNVPLPQLPPPPPPPPSQATPPTPSTISRRSNSLPTPPPPPPLAIAPPVNNINNISLRLNNFTRRESIVTPRFRSTINDNTVNTILDNINRSNVTINDLIQNNNTAIDLIEQISDIVDTEVNETEDVESDIDSSDEFSNEYSFGVSLDVENPFLPRNELVRTPPLNEESDIVEPLLNNFQNTQNDIENSINRIENIINLHLEENNDNNNDINDDNDDN